MTSEDSTPASLLSHLPRELRTFVTTMDEVRAKWAEADEVAREELRGAVSSAAVAVHLSADRSLLAVLAAVIAERQRQDEKWGEQKYDNFEGISILAEEVGEAAKAANEANFKTSPTRGDFTDLIEELTQVAAVAVNHVQIILRRTKGVRSDD